MNHMLFAFLPIFFLYIFVIFAFTSCHRRKMNNLEKKIFLFLIFDSVLLYIQSFRTDLSPVSRHLLVSALLQGTYQEEKLLLTFIKSKRKECTEYLCESHIHSFKTLVITFFRMKVTSMFLALIVDLSC